MMTDRDKWGYMTAGFTDTAVTTAEDASYMIATGPIPIGVGETKKAVFAYVGGTSLALLQSNAAAAYEKYWSVTEVGGGEDGNLPTTAQLAQNYPNPFNPRTAIRFYLPVETEAHLDLYNLMGQKVATLADGRFKAGNHVISWDATEFSSGVYFYKLVAGDKIITKRMTLLK